MIGKLCQTCKHWWGELECRAYPERIPDEYLQGLDTHFEVQEDQVGTFVYERSKIWTGESSTEH